MQENYRLKVESCCWQFAHSAYRLCRPQGSEWDSGLIRVVISAIVAGGRQVSGVAAQVWRGGP